MRQRELSKYEHNRLSRGEGKKTIAPPPFWKPMFLPGRVQTGFSTLPGSKPSKEAENAELGIPLHPRGP